MLKFLTRIIEYDLPTAHRRIGAFRVTSTYAMQAARYQMVIMFVLAGERCSSCCRLIAMSLYMMRAVTDATLVGTH